MEQTADLMGVVTPQTVWPGLSMKQQQMVMQTIASICRQMVIQHQEGNYLEPGKHGEHQTQTAHQDN